MRGYTRVACPNKTSPLTVVNKDFQDDRLKGVCPRCGVRMVHPMPDKTAVGIVDGIGQWPNRDVSCPEGSPMGHAYEQGWNAAIVEVLGRLKAMPTAQPVVKQDGDVCPDCGFVRGETETRMPLHGCAERASLRNIKVNP